MNRFRESYVLLGITGFVAIVSPSVISSSTERFLYVAIICGASIYHSTFKSDSKSYYAEYKAFKEKTEDLRNRFLDKDVDVFAKSDGEVEMRVKE